MTMRRALAVLSAALLPLAASATPAAAAPPATKVVQGAIASINTKANKIVLADGTVVKYGRDAVLATTHIYDLPSSEFAFDCDVRDNGSLPDSSTSEARFELVASQTGAELLGQVEPRSSREPSTLYVTLDTCDGVVDEADIL